MRWIALAIVALSVSGCASVSYYGQAVRGQLDVFRATRPLSDVLADPNTNADTRERLARVPEIRRFAIEQLRLADSDSYRAFADLKRSAMVWSVMAAPVDSLTPKQWCYPIVGCASYRGYFQRERAQAYADSLTSDGWDVAVIPVPAYSTLGWFGDPLPSTIMHWPLADIAGLVFHELAHETLYVRGDSAFNEAFATMVEREGVRRWLAGQGSEEQRREHRLSTRRRADFLTLLARTRERLTSLYAEPLPRAELLVRKAQVFASLQLAYAEQRDEWGGYSGYDRWFARPLNNAHLVANSTYNDLLPGFERLLRENGNDMARFLLACRRLAALPVEQRLARLGGRDE